MKKDNKIILESTNRRSKFKGCWKVILNICKFAEIVQTRTDIMDYFEKQKLLTKMNCECPPLNGGRVEVSVLDVKISGAHCLRTKTIEQGNFGSARDAN